MKDRSDDPSHHERTLLPRSYISLLPELMQRCRFFLKTLLYLMDYFTPQTIDIDISGIFRPPTANLIHNERSEVFILKPPLLYTAGSETPTNIWCGAVIFLERGKLEKIKYIDQRPTIYFFFCLTQIYCSSYDLWPTCSVPRLQRNWNKKIF